MAGQVSTLRGPTCRTADRLDASTLKDELLDLVCADEQWVRTEFDAIIAAEWPTRPAPPLAPVVSRPRLTPPRPARAVTPAPRPGSGESTLERWRRQRSPPPTPAPTGWLAPIRTG